MSVLALRAYPAVTTASGRLALRDTALAWFGSLVLLGLVLPFGISIYDEGSILTGATNVLAGQVPTLDFWSVYPAGAYVWVAAVLAMFDHQMIAVRIVDAAMLALGPALCFALVRAERGVRVAALCALGVALWVAGTGPNFLYPPPIAVLFGAVVAVAATRRPRTLGAMILLGAGMGLLATLRLDFGFFAWAATAVALLAVGTAHFRSRLIGVIAFGLGAAAVLVAVTGFYFALGGLPALTLLFDRLIRYPAGPFHLVRDLPFPVPFAAMRAGTEPVAPGLVTDELVLLLYYVVAAGLLLAFLGMLIRSRRARPQPAQLALLLLAIAAIAPFLGRSSTTQGWPFVTLGTIVLLWIFRARAVVVALAVMLIALGGIETARQLHDDYLGRTVALASPRAFGIRLPAGKAWHNGVVQVATQSRVLYSGPLEHQHVTANDTLLYFLSGHMPPTGLYEANPLVTDQVPAQTHMLADFRRTRPDTLILVPQPRTEPNLSSVSSEVALLDDALKRHCVPQQQIHRYHIFACHW